MRTSVINSSSSIQQKVYLFFPAYISKITLFFIQDRSHLTICQAISPLVLCECTTIMARSCQDLP